MPLANFKSFVVQFQASGRPVLDSERVAVALGLTTSELASLAGVQPECLLEVPANARLQEFMRESLAVIAMAVDVSGDEAKAISWFRGEPIRDFGHATPLELVASGRMDALVAYLQSIESGSSG